MVLGRTAEGATGSDTEDRGAGLDGMALGRAAEGATRSNTDDRGAGLGDMVSGRPQEARHKLKGAKTFSEFNRGNGFHQVPLHTDSHRVFQSHLRLHKRKIQFFGPTNSSGIFHHQVTEVTLSTS